MFKRYTAITTSAKILSHVLATDIDIAKIRDYFIDYHGHTVSERSLADKAIEVITQFVAQNRGKFSDDTALKNMMENYGLIALKDDYIEVKIIASVFKDMSLVFYHLKLDPEYASIFGLTKDAEPIKAEINLDNKKMLESWKKQKLLIFLM